MSLASDDQNKEFTSYDKKKLVNRIKKIKNKKKYIKLFNIIDKEYKEYTSNNNGIFINLNDLSNNVLTFIEEFLDKNDLRKKRKKERSLESESNSEFELNSDSDSISMSEFDSDSTESSFTVSFNNSVTKNDNIVNIQINGNNQNTPYEDIQLSDSEESHEFDIGEIKLTNIEKNLL